MVQVPAAAAAVPKAQRENTAGEISPVKSSAALKKRDGSAGVSGKVKRKSFSDVLKKIGSEAVSTEKKSHEIRFSENPLLKKKPSRLSGDTRALKAQDRNKAGLSPESVKRTADAESSENTESLHELHEQPELNEDAPVSLPAGISTTASSRTESSRTQNTVTRKKIRKVLNPSKSSGKHGKSGLASVESAAAGRSADLTSRASRVEVQDNRNRLSDNLSDKPDKDHHELKTRGSVAPGEQRQSAEPVKLLQHPVNAETEIEITPGNEGRNLQRSAASLLAEKLDAQAGNDIVRQVKVILNQANAGELRINLRPDNLGQVRIRIRMEDNRLTGRIFVESAAAREAFRNALDGLQTRLVESGFGAADLEMAWDESPRNFMQNGNPSAGQQNNIEEAVQEFENIIPAVFAGDSADSRVNMVV